jgi:hypothetical protein
VRALVRLVAPHAKVSRHSEVNQENSTTLEPNNQILAATTETGDALTLDLLGDLVRMERPSQSWIADRGALDPPSDDERLESATDRLDLGELRHAA